MKQHHRENPAEDGYSRVPLMSSTVSKGIVPIATFCMKEIVVIARRMGSMVSMLARP